MHLEAKQPRRRPPSPFCPMALLAKAHKNTEPELNDELNDAYFGAF